MKKLGAVLFLCCTFSFSVCPNREAGPCYGVGCPALSSKGAPAAPPAAQNSPAQDSTTTASTAAPDEKKHHHKFSLRHPF
jgi:hypothetical protein